MATRGAHLLSADRSFATGAGLPPSAWATVEHDVVAFVEQLAAKGLLEP